VFGVLSVIIVVLAILLYLARNKVTRVMANMRLITNPTAVIEVAEQQNVSSNRRLNSDTPPSNPEEYKMANYNSNSNDLN